MKIRKSSIFKLAASLVVAALIIRGIFEPTVASASPLSQKKNPQSPDSSPVLPNSKKEYPSSLIVNSTSHLALATPVAKVVQGTAQAYSTYQTNTASALNAVTDNLASVLSSVTDFFSSLFTTPAPVIITPPPRQTKPLNQTVTYTSSAPVPTPSVTPPTPQVVSTQTIIKTVPQNTSYLQSQINTLATELSSIKPVVNNYTYSTGSGSADGLANSVGGSISYINETTAANAASGLSLSDVASGLTSLNQSLNVSGSVTATTFCGDGSHLSGIGSSFSTSTTRGVFSATGPLSYATSTGTFSIQKADTTHSGYLSSADYNTFNGKLAASSLPLALNTLSAVAVGNGNVTTTLGNKASAFGYCNTASGYQSSTFGSGLTNSTDNTAMLGVGSGYLNVYSNGCVCFSSGAWIDQSGNINANTFCGDGGGLYGYAPGLEVGTADHAYNDFQNFFGNTYDGSVGQGNTTNNSNSSAFGSCNTASGCFSSASGFSNTACGLYSSAFGYHNTASGYFSSALGSNNTASGAFSSIFGIGNTASGGNSISIGSLNNSSNSFSNSVGDDNTASGCYSSAFGSFNTASGCLSSAFGYNNTACGCRSSAFGYTNTACGFESSAFGSGINNSTANSVEIGADDANKLHIDDNGVNFITSGSGGFCVNGTPISGGGGGGLTNNASGTNSIALGSGSSASGAYSSASGYHNTASGDLSSAFGSYNTACGYRSSVGGYYNTASGNNSSAFGTCNTASGDLSSAFGFYNTASGYRSSASGFYNTASGNNSSAFGTCNTASGDLSSAFGHFNTACGYRSSVGGYNNTASGDLSSASGYQNTASSLGASAFGYRNTASGYFSSAFGSGLTNSTSCSAMLGYDGGNLLVNGDGSVIFSSGACIDSSGVGHFPSDRNLKENFTPVDASSTLAAIESLPITEWNYKKNPSVSYVGPVAQDFYQAFGGLGGSSTSIPDFEPGNIALVGVQALAQQEASTTASIQGLQLQLNQLMGISTSTDATSSPSLSSNLESFGASIVDGIVNFAEVIIQKLTVSTLTIKNSTDVHQTGYVIYDRASGQPICVYFENGVQKTAPGDCEPDETSSNTGTSVQSSDTKSDTSTTTDATSTSDTISDTTSSSTETTDTPPSDATPPADPTVSSGDDTTSQTVTTDTSTPAPSSDTPPAATLSPSTPPTPTAPSTPSA